MCTVSYLPAPSGFILTSSRDEKIARPAAKLSKPVIINDHEVTFPKDPQGQGSWIAASKSRTVCLLNGAFTAHQPKPPYKHSRGLVVLHAFKYYTIQNFASTYDFTGLEPFTLLLVELGALVVLRWDGSTLFTSELDAFQPQIWSSATLYSPEIIKKRQVWFRQWLNTSKELTLESIRSFHKTAGDGNPENAVLMQRDNQYATVSLTSVVGSDGHVEMTYEDLIHNKLTHQKLSHAYVSN